MINQLKTRILENNKDIVKGDLDETVVIIDLKDLKDLFSYIETLEGIINNFEEENYEIEG